MHENKFKLLLTYYIIKAFGHLHYLYKKKKNKKILISKNHQMTRKEAKYFESHTYKFNKF